MVPTSGATADDRDFIGLHKHDLSPEIFLGFPAPSPAESVHSALLYVIITLSRVFVKGSRQGSPFPDFRGLKGGFPSPPVEPSCEDPWRLEHSTTDFYFSRLAAAYVRGRLGVTQPPLETLTERELAAVVTLGLEAGLRLHRFKRTMGLARVSRALGILQGLRPDSLLDVGSGRGAFLWPLLDRFPDLPVTAIDTDPKRVADIRSVAAGGIGTLTGRGGDVTRLEFGGGAFDVVTLLEVLEHVPQSERALSEAVRVARRFVVLSVPSHADDNPEHIHLFSRDRLADLLREAGAARVTTEAVHNHWIAVANVQTIHP